MYECSGIGFTSFSPAVPEEYLFLVMPSKIALQNVDRFLSGDSGERVHIFYFITFPVVTLFLYNFSIASKIILFIKFKIVTFSNY